jgi:fluoroquinolone transport system permease protein
MIASVLLPRRFLRLLSSDAMNVSRDPMLIFAIVMSILPAIAFAFARDAMDDAALAAFGVQEISRYVALFVLVLPAVLIGWVTGFLLLEDRDDGVLLAVDVTPIGKSGFLLYRVTVTALIGAAITAAAIPFVVPAVGIEAKILLIAAVAVESVLAAVILPAIARNKVEGLALTKLTNIAVIFPLIATIPSPWRFLASLVPTYWIGELLAGTAPALPVWVIAAGMIATHAGWAVLLFALLGRRVG